MRCIETEEVGASFEKTIKINYNMRCIETYIVTWNQTNLKVINYNMRCIETSHNRLYVFNTTLQLYR